MTARRLLACALPLALVGCMGTITSTTTARTSTEMLLVSDAAAGAVTRWNAAPLVGRRTFVDPQFLDCMDKPYVLSALRAQASRAGALLVDEPDEAERVVEVRCAGLAGWDGDYQFGLPPLPLSYFNESVMTPALTIGNENHQGWAKLQLFVYDKATGRVVGVADALWGAAREDLFGSVYPSILHQPTHEDEAADARPEYVGD
jgi:hypothetical protein